MSRRRLTKNKANAIKTDRCAKWIMFRLWSLSSDAHSPIQQYNLRFYSYHISSKQYIVLFLLIEIHIDLNLVV